MCLPELSHKALFMQAHRLLENKDKKPQHKHTTEQFYTNTGHVSTLKPCFHPPKNDLMLWIDELAFFIGSFCHLLSWWLFKQTTYLL